MRTLKNIIQSLVLIIFFSCQKEEMVLIDENNNESLTSTSPLTGLIARVSQNPTSVDNVLDNSSCFKVKLPVTVIVNGKNIVVTTEADYKTVQDAIDAFSNDDDIVNFVYPITIQFQNFQTKVIANPNQLDDVLDDCEEDDGFDEIDCVQFVFPISLNVYDAGSQTPTALILKNNSDLYNFLDDLDSNDLIEIKFPVSFINHSGQTISVTRNSQLENLIEDAIDDCDDDSGSGGGGGAVAPEFVPTLTSGTWKVSYFFDDNDQTFYFSGYIFTFSANGTVTAVKAGSALNGTWSTFIDSGVQKLLLSFDGESFDEIEEDWKLVEFNATTIKLKDVSGGDGSISYLYFAKN